MFACSFYLQLKTKDANVILERSCELPFAPCVGHRFIFDDANSEFIDADMVEYSIEDDVFWVTEFRSQSDDCICTAGDDCCVFHPDHWTESGWTIHEGPRYGPDRYLLEDWQFPNPDTANKLRGET